MTATEFEINCAKLLIAPEIALENDDLKEALRRRDDTEVIRILREEF